jgi:hypothetical protein
VSDTLLYSNHLAVYYFAESGDRNMPLGICESNDPFLVEKGSIPGAVDLESADANSAFLVGGVGFGKFRCCRGLGERRSVDL